MFRKLVKIWRAVAGGAEPPRISRTQIASDREYSAVSRLPAPFVVEPLPVVSPPAATPKRPRRVRPESDLTGDESAERDIRGNFRARGNLRITHWPRLRSIGDGLTVAGDFKLGGDHPRKALTPEKKRVPIRALPGRMFVGGSLELRNCFLLERLPADLKVGGAILLEDCDSLCELPDELDVKGSLTIVGGRSLEKLPRRLCVAGDFRISGTRVSELPADLIVGGSLVVEGRSRIRSIPAGMRVGGDITFRRCPIEFVPQGLQVARTLRLIGLCKLKTLPADLVVPGVLDLSDCVELEEIPAAVRVGRSLKLRGCRSLRELPAGLEVPGTLDLRGCTALTKLPAGLRVGFGVNTAPQGAWQFRFPVRSFAPALRLADCPALTELPEDLSLDGPIEVAGSGLHDLPASLASARVLWRGVLVPPEVVFHPERIAPLDILRQPNAELRRVMMERVGRDILLAKVGAQILDRDTDAGGARRLIFVARLNHCYLACCCPSTRREYLLRVPPGMRSCREAAAWTAGFDDPERYRPAVET